MGEFLDFKTISAVPFKKILDWQQIPYSETNKGELKGQGFIVTIAKNLYFNPTGQDKGSCINWLANHKDVDLREAAKLIKQQFIDEPKEPKRPIPELELSYTKEVEKLGISAKLAEDYEIGYAKHGIMKGKVAFLIRDEKGEKVGYVGLNPDGSWFFPKGLHRNWVYNLYRAVSDYAICVCGLPEVVHLSGLGFGFAVALGAGTATDVQVELLRQRFRRILLLCHSDNLNLVGRLSRFLFVKSIVLSKPISEHTPDDVRLYF
jgi:hypothetical protein